MRVSNALIAGSLLVMCLCGATGCAMAPPLPEVSNQQLTQLLTGEALFGSPIPAAPTMDVLEVSDDMKAFVETIRQKKSSADRLRGLVKKMQETGFLNARYEARLTQNAASTFEAQAGNCLSYTNLFVALARSVRLDARYQRVDVPPTWDVDNNLFIRSNHINVVVRDMRQVVQGREFIMDFNYVEPEADYERWVVTDRHAEALVYANLSVNALMDGNVERAFAYQRSALEVDPKNPEHWTNLGVIYMQVGALDLAEAAFAEGLRRSWRKYSAMAGLASLYRKQGDIKAAQFYEKRVITYRNRNPFYHLAVGQSAYDHGQYTNALSSFKRAIHLRPRTGAFHFMKGMTYFQLGDDARGHKSLRRALYYGEVTDLANLYRADLNDFLATTTAAEAEITSSSNGWELYRNQGFRASRSR